MRITFVLPCYSANPIGGFKVVYEYANALAQRGHKVSIVHPHALAPRATAIGRVKTRLWIHKTQMQFRPLAPWFPIAPGVRMLLVPNMEARYIPNADIVVATAFPTAQAVIGYPASKGVKFYLVYDYEFWMTASEETQQGMAETYLSGLHLIATSPSVTQMLEACGATPVAYIPCGLDHSIYRIETPIADRVKGHIGFPIRDREFKGTADAVAAAALLRERFGQEVQFAAFGPKTEHDIPAWIRWHTSLTDAELNTFYNSRSIFLLPSHYEGWGLPGVEALACGAALVTSDSVGNREYALDGVTALVVPRKRPDLMAEAVTKLLLNDSLRQELAAVGNCHVQKYTWEIATNTLEAAFMKLVAK